MNVTLSNNRRRLTLITRGNRLTLQPKKLSVLVSGSGKSGPPGPPGIVDPLTLTRIAATVLSGHRAVRPLAGNKAGYMSAATVGDVLTFLGITTGAALQDANVSIVSLGRMVEPSWTWTPGLPIYAGVDGVLTQASDNAWAFIQIIAVAITATEIFVSPKIPITL